MSMAQRMIPAEFEYLQHLALDGRDLYAKGIKAAHVEATVLPGTLAAGSIPVTGQVVDAMGKPVAGVFDVVIKVYAPTGGQGLITAATSPVGVIKMGSGTIEVWMQTSAAGAFAFKVADSTSGELALCRASVGDGITASAELQY